jgi:hypothetical protein
MMPFFNFTHNVIDWIMTRQSIVKYWCHIVLCVYFFQMIQRAQIEEKSKKKLVKSCKASRVLQSILLETNHRNRLFLKKLW